MATSRVTHEGKGVTKSNKCNVYTLIEENKAVINGWPHTKTGPCKRQTIADEHGSGPEGAGDR